MLNLAICRCFTQPQLFFLSRVKSLQYIFPLITNHKILLLYVIFEQFSEHFWCDPIISLQHEDYPQIHFTFRLQIVFNDEVSNIYSLLNKTVLPKTLLLEYNYSNSDSFTKPLMACHPTVHIKYTHTQTFILRTSKEAGKRKI